MINWNIKHKLIWKDDLSDYYYYLCNQAVTFNFMKGCRTWRGVTCKNCLKLKELK